MSMNNGQSMNNENQFQILIYGTFLAKGIVLLYTHQAFYNLVCKLTIHNKKIALTSTVEKKKVIFQISTLQYPALAY